MAHIEGVVLSMDFMFYPTGGVEAGIDGFIEIRDRETGAVGNLLLQVQGKPTERQRLLAETEDTFEFPCSEADISYWMQGTAPVLLIVVHLEKGVGLGRRRIELRARVLKACQNRRLGTSPNGALSAGRDLGFPPHPIGRPRRHRVPCDSPDHGGIMPLAAVSLRGNTVRYRQRLLRPDHGR